MRIIPKVTLSLTILLIAATASAQQTVFLNSSTNREVWKGETTGSGFGTYLDRGELSGDSRRDLIVGSPAWGSAQGRVYVVFSGPVRGGTLSAAQADVILTGGGAGDQFGASTAAGWVTTQELAAVQLSRDLVVGAPNANGGAGAVYLFRRGFNSGQRLAVSDALLTINGAAGDHIGSALATGDMDGDGYREIIIGAPGTSRVYVIKGGPSVSGTINLSTQSALMRLDGPTGAGVGSVLAAGDVTGDAAYDLAIGAPDLAPAGATYLIAGHMTGGLTPTVSLATGSDAVFTGIDAGDRAGASLAIGPYDGDTKWDLIIGAPNAAGPGNARAGAGEVYAIWGAAALSSRSASAADFTIFGAATGWHVGSALYMGDVDRTGPPLDLAILAPGAEGGAGDALLLFGRPRSQFPATWDFALGWDRRIVGDPSATPMSSLLVYDHTGEGAEDIIVGSPSVGEGLVYISFSPLPQAVISYPSNNEAIGGTTAPFQWSQAASSTTYRLMIGTTVHGSDLLDTGLVNTTSFPMPSLPAGQTLYAHLGTQISGNLVFTDSTFTVLPAPAFMFPTDHLSGVRPGFFSWSAPESDTTYELFVGTTQGGRDLLDSGLISATSYHVFSLPPGRTLFARITGTTAGSSSSTDVTFTTAPAAGSTSADAIGAGIGTNFGGTPGGDAFLYKPSTGAWTMQQSNSGSFVGINSSVWATNWTIQAGDFNGDGLTDLFLYNPTNGLWFKVINLGGGNFNYFGGTWAPNWNVTLLDFDGDGKTDVFLYNQTNGRWFRAMSVGDGDFSYVTGVWAPGWSIYPADFNGDGRADLFLYNHNAASDPNHGLWFRVLTAADGSFTYLLGEVRWANTWTVTPADLNGDGLTDLFLYDSTNGQYFRVVFVNGVATYDGGTWAANWTISKGDFNGDGLADLFLYNRTTGLWFVVITNPDGTLSYFNGLWAPNWDVTITDFDADGRSDILLYNPATGMWFQAVTVSPGTFSFTTGNWGTGWNVIGRRTILP